MPPSQLKQLKAAIHDRRNAKTTKKLDRRSLKSSTTAASTTNQRVSTQKKRPKSQGELTRRLTLLPALQRRHKVGGILDRRIGEDDPTMEPEERALQRYTRQRSNRNSIFNLEDDEDETELTHLGRPLHNGGVNGNVDHHDAFDENDLDSRDGDEHFMQPAAKRRRISDSDHPFDANPTDQQEEPQVPKSKKEVMQEVIAKSKMHKLERQKIKDEDEDIRESLDKGLPDLLAALKAESRTSLSTALQYGPANSEAGLGSAKTSQTAEKQYDQSIRQLAQDQRAKPVDRTKTNEEKAEEEAARLKALEQDRLRRMRGESSDSDDDDDDDDDQDSASGHESEKQSALQPLELDVEDEDDFIIDKDLVASGSEIDSNISQDSDSQGGILDDDDDDDDEEGDENNRQPDEDDLEFLQAVLHPTDASGSAAEPAKATNLTSLPYTYECPRDHGDLLEITHGIDISDLPIIIQRIRALYHPQLKPQNNEKLAKFAVVLVEHLPLLASQKAPLDVVAHVIRHIHSLSRKYADAASEAFRDHLRQMQARSDISGGDLFILTAIGCIYPTSDHFHQIVTPAITIMARWLAMHSGRTTKESNTGAYLVALCIKYQQLSKRYVPEAIRFTIGALKHDSKSSLSKSHVKNMMALMDLWSDKSAFIEIFSPSALAAIGESEDSQALRKLKISLSQARIRRRPLELHHHRPLPIRTAIPRFEENFDPNKHYDPDRERAESQKLRKEYKREKKGALRELRKDAGFIAREKLRAKKEADAAYEAKQRRLIAEIQGEEGREKNDYEREKRKRKARK